MSDKLTDMNLRSMYYNDVYHYKFLRLLEQNPIDIKYLQYLGANKELLGLCDRKTLIHIQNCSKNASLKQHISKMLKWKVE